MSALKKIYSLLFFLLFCIFNMHAQTSKIYEVRHKDYNILLQNKATNDIKLIKSYARNGSFLITYQCKCYLDSTDLEFYYDIKVRNNKSLVKAKLPEVMSLDEFAVLAKEGYNKFSEINSHYIYLIEPLNEYSYMKYRVIFFSKQHGE